MVRAYLLWQALALIAPVNVFGTAPAIQSIVNPASGDARFSPGMPAELRYSAPDSFDAGSDRVLVGGKPVAVADEEDGQSLMIALPADLPLGPTDVVIETGAGASAPVRITVDAYSPGIFAPGPSPLFSWGIQPYGCSQTAATGDIVYLFAIGLGKPDATGAAPKPVVMVGGKTAEVIETAPAILPGLGFLPSGAYRFQFAVPPGDGLHLVTISIGGQKSNPAPLPVGKAMLSLSTPSFSPRLSAPPEAIRTVYHCNGESFVRQPGIVSGILPDLSMSLAGVSIAVKDSAGVERLALVYGVTADQVNYVVPAGTAPGTAAVTAMSDGRAIAEADLEIVSVAPDLFWTVAAQVVRLRNGVQFFEEMPQIDMGPATDDVYLVLYGTGFRFRSSLDNVTATIGGISVPVTYAGAQGGQPGLDQLNLHLPRSLAGLGATQLEFTVDGKGMQFFLFFQ